MVRCFSQPKHWEDRCSSEYRQGWRGLLGRWAGCGPMTRRIGRSQHQCRPARRRPPGICGKSRTLCLHWCRRRSVRDACGKGDPKHFQIFLKHIRSLIDKDTWQQWVTDYRYFCYQQFHTVIAKQHGKVSSASCDLSHEDTSHLPLILQIDKHTRSINSDICNPVWNNTWNAIFDW